jgi:hypothetical protein
MKAPIETVINEKNENPQKAATTSGQPVRHSALRPADMSKFDLPRSGTIFARPVFSERRG